MPKMAQNARNPKLIKVRDGVYTVRDYKPPTAATRSEFREVARRLLKKVEIPAKSDVAARAASAIPIRANDN